MRSVILSSLAAPQPLFELPSLSSITISTYPLMICVGAVGMLVYIWMRREKFQLNKLQCVLFALLLTACGIAGAKLLFILENIPDALAGNLGTGGVSFFGSVYLIPLVMPLVGKLFKLSPSKTNDLCAPCVAIMIGCIRIGCMLNGCCGGWVIYVGNYYFAWPTQIMECIGDFLLLAWLLRLEKKGQHQAVLYPLFMLGYSIMRFFIEFLRYSSSKHLGLSNGHWFAIAAVLAALLWLNIHKRNIQPANKQRNG